MNTVANRVVVEPIMSDEKSSGGIIVSDAYRERSTKAKVVAAGSKVKWLPLGSIVHHVPKAGEALDNGCYAMLDIDIRAFYVN